MATKNRVTIGSGNGLLPDGTKPSLEPIDFSVRPSDAQLRAISRRPSISKSCLKITYLKCHANLSVASELNTP